MDDLTDSPGGDPSRVVRLARAPSEAAAHILAHAIENAGFRARVAGLETIASQIVPGSSQFAIEILVLESKYDQAREILESLQTHGLAVDGKDRCVVCRYDMSASRSPICPECGTDLEALGNVGHGFVMDPPPGDDSLLKNPGALLGMLVLVALAVSCLGFALFELITTLMQKA